MTDSAAYPSCKHGRKIYEHCAECLALAHAGIGHGFIRGDAAPVLTNERTVESLRKKWEKATPFYYDMDHEAVGILFAEIERLDKKCAALAFLQYGSPPEQGKASLTKTASEMSMAEIATELRRRNELQPVGDNFLLDLANRLADEPTRERFLTEARAAEWSAAPCAGIEHRVADEFHTPDQPCPISKDDPRWSYVNRQPDDGNASSPRQNDSINPSPDPLEGEGIVRSLVNHWNEFGPDHGLRELMDTAHRWLQRRGVNRGAPRDG